MTPDYERVEVAAHLLAEACRLQRSKPSDYTARTAENALARAASYMGFVLAPMMPEQPAPEKKPKTGTLAQLNVKPGDVVEFEMHTGNWRRHSISHIEDGNYYSADTMEILGNVNPWRIVSRASQPAPDDLRAAYDREVLE